MHTAVAICAKIFETKVRQVKGLINVWVLPLGMSRI